MSSTRVLTAAFLPHVLEGSIARTPHSLLCTMRAIFKRKGSNPSCTLALPGHTHAPSSAPQGGDTQLERTLLPTFASLDGSDARPGPQEKDAVAWEERLGGCGAHKADAVVDGLLLFTAILLILLYFLGCLR